MTRTDTDRFRTLTRPRLVIPASWIYFAALTTGAVGVCLAGLHAWGAL